MSTRNERRKEDETIVRKVRLGIYPVAIGMGLTLVPAVTASATVETSAVCKAYNTDVKLQSKGSAALAKQIASGKWSSIQKALLTEFSQRASAEKDFSSFLSGAPAKVKAAANVAVGLDNKFKSIVQHSSNVQQFGTAIGKAEHIPKVVAALGVLGNYARTLKCATP
jgi:hypothetical protein